MSRYVFVAAAALFAGLLLIFAFSLAHRDARISQLPPSDSVPAYADQLASPIAVQKAALEDETSVVVPQLVAESERFETQLVSHSAPLDDNEPQPPTSSKSLTEPPRFDASRIFSKRPDDKVPTAPLLNPTPKGSAYVPSATRSSEPGLLNTPNPLPQNPTPAPPLATLGTPQPPPVSTPSPELSTPPLATSPLSTSPQSSPLPSASLPTVALPTIPLPITPSPNTPSPNTPSPNSALLPDPEPPKQREENRSLPTNMSASSNFNSNVNHSNNPTVPSNTRGTWSMSSGAPGARQFDGSQNPSLEIIKRAPAEVQVGIPATFTAIVRNVGNATAFDVEVFDTVPRGAKLVRTLPQAETMGRDAVVWKLGELAAGQETTISMELIPETEGEIGSVASVKFAAQASVRTMSTLPKLSVKQWGPNEILGGDTIKVWIEVANVGTGTAKDVELQEDVPTAFRHVSGARSLGLQVGDLAPGESQRYEIDLTAVEAAKVTNLVRATARNAATNESSQPMEVRAPKLRLQLNGPRIRYLERPAPFEAVIENAGTALARDLYIVAYLPRGLHFSSANNEGTYLPDQHAIAWNLAELAAGTQAKTEFTVLPVEEGKSLVRMTSDAEGLGVESIERDVQVEGQSELTFDIDDDHDPIETGGVTTYTVHLTNIGTRPDENIVLSIEIPDGSTVEQVDSPTKYRVQGRTVLFEPYAALPPKDRAAVKVRIRHSREGTQVFRASVQSALRPVPVIKEESTKVYVDR